MSVHTAKGLWSQSGLWLWPSWSYLKSVYNASWGHPHMYLSPCDQITLDWWKYHVWSVWEAAWPRWAEREWENWYWWMIWYKMQHWKVWKINIFTGSEDIIRLIFLFTMLPPDAQTTCGPFELNGFCGAHATTPTFLPPPPHKPRRSTLTDRDTLWQQSTSGRICKAHRVVCMSKKKKKPVFVSRGCVVCTCSLSTAPQG